MHTCKRALWGAAVLAMGLTSSLRAGDLPDTDGWESEIVLGASLADGNTESTMLKAGLATLKRQGPIEIRAAVDYAYGETTIANDEGVKVDEKTTDNAKAQAQINRLFSERAYGYLQANALTDDIADIDYRVIAGPGVGLYAVKREAATLKLELGPSGLWEKQGGETDDAVLVRFAEVAEWNTPIGARLWQSAEYLPRIDQFDEYLLNAEAGAESALTESMNLRVVLGNRYDSHPAEGRERNDLTITAGVVVKL